MEARALAGESFNRPGHTSRMVEDLSVCSENFICSLQRRLETKVKDHDPVAVGNPQHLHVGIVGAGLAGLRCADVLIGEGIAVTMIEARDRLGGRIHQCRFGDRLIDMGPNWIYGSKENPMVQLALDTDTKLGSPTEINYVYDSKGTLMDDEKALESSTALWKILGDAFRLSSENCGNIDPALSLKDFLRETLLTSGLDEELQEVVQELAETWGAYVGDSFERQSLKWAWLEECLEGENTLVSSTHEAILERVSEAVRSRAELHPSTIVRGIDTRSKEKGAKKVVVYTTNGNFSFDEVVITVPLGCLQMGALEFHPGLPQTISQAITDASYGRLEKAFLSFAVPFWDQPNLDAFEKGDTSLTTTPTFPVFTHFLRPTYVPEDQKSWTLEMVALSSPAVFGAHAQPVLMFYLWGASAGRVSSATAGLSPASDEYYNVIERLFRPFYSRLPYYRPNHPDCVPVAVLATNWQNDEFAGKGSYTNFMTDHRGGQPKGDPAVDEGVRAMRQGLPERGIWFAGEHTAPFVALGTSTGAYWSGEAVATRIIEANTM